MNVYAIVFFDSVRWGWKEAMVVASDEAEAKQVLINNDYFPKQEHPHAPGQRAYFISQVETGLLYCRTKNDSAFEEFLHPEAVVSRD